MPDSASTPDWALPVNSPPAATPDWALPVNSSSSPTSAPEWAAPVAPITEQDFQTKLKTRWGPMLAGQATTTPADITEMQASGRFTPDQMQRMQVESGLRQKFADEQAQTFGQKVATAGQSALSSAGQMLQDVTVLPRVFQTAQEISQNPGGFWHDLGRLGQSAAEGTYDAAKGLGSIAVKSITGPAGYINRGAQTLVGQAPDAEADYQKWKMDYLANHAVPGYAAPPSASPVQIAEGAWYGLNPSDIPAPITPATSLVSTGATMAGFGGAAKAAESAIPAISDKLGLSDLAPNLVAKITPGATGQAMKLRNTMNAAIEKAEALPPTPPISPAVKPIFKYLGEGANGKPILKLVEEGKPEVPGTPPTVPFEPPSPGIASKAASAAGQVTAKTGESLAGLAAIPQKAASWLTSKLTNSSELGQKLVGYLRGGAFGDIVGLGHLGLPVPGLGHVVGTLRLLDRLGAAGEKLSNVGNFVSRVAEADPNTPFGRFLTLAADPASPPWMKSLAAHPMTQLGLRAGNFAAGVAGGAAKGAAAGAGLGVISGDSPEEIGQNAAAMGLFGGVQGGLGAKDAKIFDSHVGNVGEFIGRSLEAGTAPETLRLVPADAVLNAAIWSKAFPQVKTRFATPSEPGSPFAKGGIAEGRAGVWDSPNKTVWVDPSANRAPMNTLMHEWFHPVFDQMVAQRPEIKAALDRSLQADGKTIEDFRQDYGAKAKFTPEQMQQFSPDDAYSELLAESAQHHLYDADLTKAAQGKYTQATATQEALRTLQGWMSTTGIQNALASKQRAIAAQGPEGEVFPKFRGVFASPDLRDLSTRLLKSQRDLQMGREAAETQGTPVDKDYAKSMPFWKTPDGRNINPYGELVPDNKGGQKFVTAPPSVLRQRAKTQSAAFQKYFQPGTPVKDVPPGFYNDPDITPWAKDAVRQTVDAIANKRGLQFYNHQLNKEVSATSDKSWAQDARMTMGNTEARLMRGTPDSLEITKKGNLILRLASESAIDAKLAKWANQSGPASLDLWGGDTAKVAPDLAQYLQNHVNGQPGETGIGTQKRDVLNAMLFGANKEFQGANPIREKLTGADKKAIWRSPRLDRMEAPQSYDPGRAPASWEAGKRNLSPDVSVVESLPPATPLPTDAADYAGLQQQMKSLDFADPEFDKKLMPIFAKMEEIKNRNRGYAPGTGPHETTSAQSKP